MIDLWMLSVMSFESMIFVQNWWRYGCSKFWCWIFFHSIHACCYVSCWFDHVFMLYIGRSLQWYTPCWFLDMLRFSGKFEDEDLEDLHRVHNSCTFPADLVITFIAFPANLHACSSTFPADYEFACLGFEPKRLRFHLARLDFQISSGFDPWLQHYFNCFTFISFSLHFFTHYVTCFFF